MTLLIFVLRLSVVLTFLSISCFSLPPPNIIFLLSESLDGRLLNEGSAAKIPNIRRLQSMGSVTFTTSYSNNPVCAPSRSSLWSGRAPHKIVHEHNGFVVNGAWNNFEGLPLNYSSKIDDLLSKESNYTTSILGKTDYSVGGHTESCFLASFTFNVAWPFNIPASGGWNEEGDMCASPGPVSPGGSNSSEGSVYPSDWKLFEEAAAFVKHAQQPYFAFVGSNILHPPYGTSQYWYDVASDNQSLPVWPPLEDLHPCDLQASMKRGCTPPPGSSGDFYDPARIARVRRVYLAELEEFDAMVGSLMRAVEEAGGGLAENTYWFLASDHGDLQLEHQGFYKMMPQEASSHIALLVASPQLAAGGARSVTQPTQLLDIFPTMLSLAGLPIPAYADGYDLSPFLRGAGSDPSRPPFVVSQNHDEDISMSWFAIMDGTYKLVQYGTGDQVPPQLFNLSADPRELINFFNTSSAYQAVAEDLDAKLRSNIDYPTVALDVALYQKQQFHWWTVNGTSDWETEIKSQDVRWNTSWAEYPDQALAAVKEWMANASVYLQPCNGKLTTNTTTQR